MGLDVYLYHYKKPATEIAKDQKEFSDATEELWNKVFDNKDYAGAKALPDYETRHKKYESEKKKLAKKFNCTGEYDGHKDEVKIEINSKKYPEQMFKIGYFRSSYNSSGINGVLRDRISVDLYSIFGVNHDEYRVSPDWTKSRARAIQALALWKKFLDENGTFGVSKIAANIFSGPNTAVTDEKTALEVFQKTRKEHSKPAPFGNNFSNNQGDFHLENPLKVYGLIHGVDADGGAIIDVISKGKAKAPVIPVVYVIYESHGFGSYTEALEIVLETIDYVLAQKDPQNYGFHWSG